MVLGVPNFILGDHKIVSGVPIFVSGDHKIILGVPNFISGVHKIVLGDAKMVSGVPILVLRGAIWCPAWAKTVPACVPAGSVLAVDLLNLNVSDPPQQTDVQAIADKLDETLRHGKRL